MSTIEPEVRQRRGSATVGKVRHRAQAAKERVDELRERARRERGIRVRETITVRGPAASETEARVAEVLGGAGCSQASVGPGRFRYARAVRPLPVAVGGTAASIATLGLALPSLLFRRTEECLVSIDESPTGAQVTVVGLVPSAAMTRLRADLGSPRWAVAPPPGPTPWEHGEGPTVSARQAAALAAPSLADPPTRTVARPRPTGPADPPTRPVDRTRPVGPADPPTRAVSDLTRPVGPVDPPTRAVSDLTRPAGPADDRTADPRTRAVPRTSDRPDEHTRVTYGQPSSPEARPVAGGSVLELDTGERLAVRGALVIGRNPDPSTGTPVRLEDRERTISKSHFRILVEPDGTWIEDLASTNGTALSLPDGRTAALRPGRRYPLVAGTRIRFGDRHARFVTD